MNRIKKISVAILLLTVTVSKSQEQLKYDFKNVEIVGGGFVSGLMYHPKQKDLVYARTDIGGAYRMDAKTGRWIPLQDQFGLDEWNNYGVESFAVDPSDPNKVYQAVGTYTNNWAGNGAILRSNDQGNTWQISPLPFKLGGNENGRSMGERLAVDPVKGNIIYFGTRNQGLYKSEDYGATWNKIESFPAIETEKGIGLPIVFYDGNVIYVAAASKETHLYQSTDQGKTWNEVAGQTKGFLPHHAALARDRVLYITYSDGPGPNGVADGAVRKLDLKTGVWSDITPMKPKVDGKPNFGYAGLTIDGKDQNIVMVSTLDRWGMGDDIYRSRDGGKTWASVKEKSKRDSSLSPFLNWGRKEAEFGHWMGDIEIDPFNSNVAMYGTGATIWRTDNLTAIDKGQTIKWTVGAAGLEETAVLELISPPDGAHLLSALGDVGGFRHDDFTVSPKQGMFTNPLINSTTDIDFAQSNPRIIVRAGHGGVNARSAYSLDGGKSWQPFPTEPPGATSGQHIAIASDGKTIINAMEKIAPVWSDDFGKTWNPCNGLGSTMRVIADRVNATIFYAFDKPAHTLMISRDAGKTFTSINDKLPAGFRKVRAAAGKAGHLWLPSDSAGLLRSSDYGKTWTKIDSIDSASAVGFGKSKEGSIYPTLYVTGKIKSISGVYRSTDEGKSWQRVTDDKHQFGNIYETVIGDPRVFGRVYIGCNGRGIIYGDEK